MTCRPLSSVSWTNSIFSAACANCGGTWMNAKTASSRTTMNRRDMRTPLIETPVGLYRRGNMLRWPRPHVLRSWAAISILLLLIGPLAGCGSTPRWEGDDVVVLVAGASGNGPWYDGVRDALKAEEGQPGRRIYTYRWGAALPLFVFNFQDRGIHKLPEEKLAQGLVQWRAEHPDGRIQLVGHSAGCGVALGALSRLDELAPAVKVERVLLLAPSVSAGMNCRRRCRTSRDRCMSSTAIAMTCISTGGPIRSGLTTTSKPPPRAIPDSPRRTYRRKWKPRLVQYPYDMKWSEIGHDGGHWGSVEERFVAAMLRPLLH